MALDPSEISVRKSKLGGGGLMETLEGFRFLVVWKTGKVLLNTGNVDFRASMAGSERAMWVFCIINYVSKDVIFHSFIVFFFF